MKTDDGIMHQMFEVLGSKCKGAVESLKCDMLMSENVTLEMTSKPLGARHNEMKRSKKSEKKRRKRRGDSDSMSESSESSVETEDDRGLAWRIIEEVQKETMPEMRRQLVSSWRDRDGV